MPPQAIIALFDLIAVVGQQTPAIIDAIARLKEKGVTPENIAAERAALVSIDTSDPLGKVPDPAADPDPPEPFNPAAPGPVN